ncbi:unnamed protein product [Cuscuta epithymum]|uniref:Uncharacterized protein n=1 Tax=Cuscuta epithymum TaxID=186058 RepID=A0AAV0DT34_9ASTE|nr:unnamed protein product [Cuscuta epithymum]CAH9129138.1 unnamed protein product [Cuscuta epithymum]
MVFERDDWDAMQGEGWPLGLRPLSLRVVRNRDHYLEASTSSFNTTLLGDSPAASSSVSSAFDTESTGSSFFLDRSTTLGTLIGITRIMNLSRRSTRETVIETVDKKHNWSRCFSMCPTKSTDAADMTSIRSHKAGAPLGHFLAVERSDANRNDRIIHHNPMVYGPDEYDVGQKDIEPNSLFSDGHIAPPQVSKRTMESENEHSVPLVLFPCICG